MGHNKWGENTQNEAQVKKMRLTSEEREHALLTIKVLRRTYYIYSSLL